MTTARDHGRTARGRRSRLHRLVVPVGLTLAAALLCAPAAGTTSHPDLPAAGYHRRVVELPPDVTPWGWGLLDVDVHGRAAGFVGATYTWPGSAAVWDATGRLNLLPDLGFGGGALAMSDPDRVAGQVYDAHGLRHAALWTAGVLRVVDPDAAVESWATTVNRSGQVAGMAADGVGGLFAFVWGPTTGTRDVLPVTPAGPWYSPTVRGLDDSGTVVGTTSWPPGQWPQDGPVETLYRWTPSGGLVDLLAGPRAQVPYYRVEDVELSASGVVVARGLRLPDTTWEQVTWVVPPGRPPLAVAVVPRVDEGLTEQFLRVDVDDRGRVVATSPQPASGCTQAYSALAWDAPHGSSPLPLGLCGAIVQATNDAGEVAGLTEPTSAGGQVFVWDARHGPRAVGVGAVVALSEAGHVLGRDGAVWDPPEGVVTRRAPVVADTTVLPAAPTRPYGTQPWLGGGGGAIGLLRIAVPPPPTGRALVAATLIWRTTDAAGAGTTAPLEVRRVVGPWTQGTTWAARPALGSRRLGVVGAVGAGEPLAVRLDPRDVPARGGELDLALLGPGTDGIRIASREAADPTQRPLLELVYR